MKKMKKIAATLLCLGVAISTLCACSSTGSGGEQPAEETTTKQTEAVMEAPETTTEETTTTAEETTEAPAEAEIIPLWNKMTVDYNELTINQLLSDTPPADWFTKEFLSGIGFYWPFLSTDRKVNGNSLYQLDTSARIQDIVLCDPTDNSDYNVEVYFLVASENSVVTYFDANGTTANAMFLPLYYNTAKKCLVGYWVNGDATTLVEFYWNGSSGGYFCLEPEDPSVYGF